MDSQYQLKLRSEENGKIYSFDSADGLNSKNSFRDEELLLADEVKVRSDDKLLIIQSNYGFLGTVMGEKAGYTLMHETSARACHFSQKNAEANSIENFEVKNTASIEEIDGKFDKIIYAPADYAPVDLVKNRLTESVEKLEEDGELYISGRKKSGIKRYRNHLKEHGELDKIGKRGSVQAYSFKPEESLETVDIEKEFNAEVDSVQAKFKTAEGLFSSVKLDEGTRILLENLGISGSEKVLDAACGYGAISVLLGKQQDCPLFLIDDDIRATSYAENNLRENGLENFTVETGDCLDPFQDQKFDAIVSNPPTHQGKGITRKIFRQAYNCLKKGGEFWLVYNQNMKYEKQLEEKFDSVTEVVEKENFKVVKAEK